MIQVVGMYRGQFISGRFSVSDKDDLNALNILCRGGFVGAIWGTKAALRCIHGGKQ